jgi:hypothetical protein
MPGAFAHSSPGCHHSAVSTRSLAPWRAAGWHEDATAWIDASLMAAGMQRTGPIEQPHLRPWSTVLRIPVRNGAVFFKETAPTMANDAGLTKLLSTVVPSVVTAPLAVEGRRMLMSDAGPRLREELDRERDLRWWERILPAYAELQREAAAHVDALLDAGALDNRLERLPALLAELLDDPGLELQAAEIDALRGLQPALAAACAALSVTAQPSIQHDDLHDGNVHLDGDGFRILDWGDASVSHPFGTLLVTLRSVAYRFEIAEDAPELDRLRHAYLEPWQDLGSKSELRQASELATWLAIVGRAVVWRNALVGADAGELAEWGDAVPDALRMVIDRRPEG